MNNKKYHTKEYKAKQEAKVDRLYGTVSEYTKKCERCDKSFVFKGRIKTKAFKSAIFCSRSCANNRQTWWNDNATGYRTIAFTHWDKQCAICGFNKVVAIHHIDNNRHNNSPENLIPLCPNHHEMLHSKWSNEVVPLIENIVNFKWGISEMGSR